MSGHSTIKHSLIAAFAAIVAGSVAVSAAVGPAQAVSTSAQASPNA